MNLPKCSSPPPRNWKPLSPTNSSNSNSRPSEGTPQATALDSLLGSLIAELGIEGKLAECRAQLAWEEVAGPSLARHARALRVRNGRLEVAVPSAVWRSQLSFMQQDIILRLNELAGSPVIKELVLVNK
jgi:predicted nucleic acid-binding Zn ribbon protein